jgi:hypothetical protein
MPVWAFCIGNVPPYDSVLPSDGSADTDCAFAVAANPANNPTLRTVDLSMRIMQSSEIVQTRTSLCQLQINILHNVAPQQLILRIFSATSMRSPNSRVASAYRLRAQHLALGVMRQRIAE